MSDANELRTQIQTAPIRQDTKEEMIAALNLGAARTTAVVALKLAFRTVANLYQLNEMVATMPDDAKSAGDALLHANEVTLSAGLLQALLSQGAAGDLYSAHADLHQVMHNAERLLEVYDGEF